MLSRSTCSCENLTKFAIISVDTRARALVCEYVLGKVIFLLKKYEIIDII